MSKGSSGCGFPLLLFSRMNKMTQSRNGGQTQPSAGQRIWRYGPLLLWILFISFASTSEFSAANTSHLFRPLLLWLFPNLGDGQLAAAHFFIRKAAHFTEYALLAFLARRAFITSSNTFIRQRWFQLGLLLVVGCALLDEFHQYFVPSRTGSIYDSAIDVAGGLTVLIVYKLRSKQVSRLERAN